MGLTVSCENTTFVWFTRRPRRLPKLASYRQQLRLTLPGATTIGPRHPQTVGKGGAQRAEPTGF
jgi:hypothetical protein